MTFASIEKGLNWLLAEPPQIANVGKRKQFAYVHLLVNPRKSRS